MAELTTEQQQFFEEKRSELLTKFTNPQYKEYKIKYTVFSHKADLCISRDQSITDYLAIGLACLAKELSTDSGGSKNGKRVIYVKHKDYPTPDMVRLHDLRFPSPYGGRSLPPNALIDIHDKCSQILDAYFHDDKTFYHNCLAGMLLYSTITCAVMEYSKADFVDLGFENFEDTLSAQKQAFTILRDLTISNILGALYAYFYGED